MDSEILLPWSDFKIAYASAPKRYLAYISIENKYITWFNLFGVMIKCDELFKDGRTETTEFETSYIPLANPAEAEQTRIVNCQIGRKLHDRYVTFTTADDQNFDNTDENQVSYGDVTYWLRDANGDLTTVNGEAVQTIMDFMPTWDYEVSGGYLFIPAVLPTPVSAWELHIIGAPDIPAEYGGSLPFVANPRISFRAGDYFFLDSSLNPANVSGEVSPYARKIRWIISHPLGAQAEFQLNMKVFR